MPSDLLVVGARNFDDQGPAGSCRRLSGERGGGGGPIGGEIYPPPPSHVSLTPPGVTGYDSERLKEMEEEVCCLTSSREALPHGWRIVEYSTRRRIAAYGYYTDSAPKVPTRADGETSALRNICV
jgi:hypothetical protein